MKINICDKCSKQTKEVSLLIVKGKKYELCSNCTESIIKLIETKKKENPNFIERMKENLESLNVKD